MNDHLHDHENGHCLGHDLQFVITGQEVLKEGADVAATVVVGLGLLLGQSLEAAPGPDYDQDHDRGQEGCHTRNGK